jgi:hypothetical protein
VLSPYPDRAVVVRLSTDANYPFPRGIRKTLYVEVEGLGQLDSTRVPDVKDEIAPFREAVPRLPYGSKEEQSHPVVVVWIANDRLPFLSGRILFQIVVRGRAKHYIIAAYSFQVRTLEGLVVYLVLTRFAKC